MTDEELAKKVEENLVNVELNAKGKMFFCSSSDGRYALALCNLKTGEIRYHFFSFAEAMVFCTEMKTILDRDSDKRTN